MYAISKRPAYLEMSFFGFTSVILIHAFFTCFLFFNLKFNIIMTDIRKFSSFTYDAVAFIPLCNYSCILNWCLIKFTRISVFSAVSTAVQFGFNWCSSLRFILFVYRSNYSRFCSFTLYTNTHRHTHHTDIHTHTHTHTLNSAYAEIRKYVRQRFIIA